MTKTLELSFKSSLDKPVKLQLPKYILLKLLIKQQLFYLKIRNRYKENAINLV